MMIVQGVCDSFRLETLQGVHDLTSDVLFMALYGAGAQLTVADTVYKTAGEVVGSGYTAGGKSIGGVQLTADGAAVMVTFGDVVWTGAVFTARAALVYNVSKGNRAVAVFDFGAEKVTPPSGEFRVVIPPATRDSAILRFN